MAICLITFFAILIRININLIPAKNYNFSQKLIWPLNCTPDEDCFIVNYPDLDNDGIQSDCNSNIKSHKGTDISISFDQMDLGVDVYAAADGEVLWAYDGKYDKCVYPYTNNPDCIDSTSKLSPNMSEGTTVCTGLGPYCPNSNESCFWCFAGGNVIVIKHANSLEFFATRYDHLKNGSIMVKTGDIVKQGQKIAQVGSSGHSGGPHLHFELWINFNIPADPWMLDCSLNDSLSLWTINK